MQVVERSKRLGVAHPVLPELAAAEARNHVEAHQGLNQNLSQP